MKPVSQQVTFNKDSNVNVTLKSFQDLETMGTKPEKKQTEIQITVLENYIETVKFKNNIYEVRLPCNERASNNELDRKKLYNFIKNGEMSRIFFKIC